MSHATPTWPKTASDHASRPQTLPMRQRADLMRDILVERLDTIMPTAMREADIDMYLVICQEDDLDPVFKTLIPMDTWCPIIQMLIFVDRGETDGLERINLSMTRTGGIYDKPWNGTDHNEQWTCLADIVRERDPKNIGINIGSIQWAAGGLTHNLYNQLTATLGTALSQRLVSAEPLVTRWLATLSPRETTLYEHIGRVAHTLLADCYSRNTITPGVTTTTDLEWVYWQMAADQGLEMAFKPFFNLVRSDQNREQFGPEDQTIRPGDFIHSDVGIKLLGLNSDHQHWCYVLKPRESAPPDGMVRLLKHATRLQDIFMAEFQTARTGNELLASILDAARRNSIPGAKIYSHSLGHFLHEPGPLIGLPWEQEHCPGRGDVTLQPNYAFTMELCVRDTIPEWNDQEVTLSIEEDVLFNGQTCRPIDGRQTTFYQL